MGRGGGAVGGRCGGLAAVGWTCQWAGQPTQVDELFGGVPAGGSGEGPNVAKLTATFFATYLLMATQVRATSSRRSVGLST